MLLKNFIVPVESLLSLMVESPHIFEERKEENNKEARRLSDLSDWLGFKRK